MSEGGKYGPFRSIIAHAEGAYSRAINTVRVVPVSVWGILLMVLIDFIVTAVAIVLYRPS